MGLETSTFYNVLGGVTDINLGSPGVLKTTFGYYGTGGAYDTYGGYFGRLWEIKTTQQTSGSPVIQDTRHTWDAMANLTQRQNLAGGSETETFSYDFLDRLTAVSGACSETYAYDPLGNITAKNGTSYAYSTNGVRPHAVTSDGSTNYVYDENGNMTHRGTQTLTWDVENRVKEVTGGAHFEYDGDGNRIKKTEGGQTTVYINRYYEKNITTAEITTSYYLGSKLIAQRKGTTLNYVLQDHLGSTSVTTDSSGAATATIKYCAFGATRSTIGTLPTDIKFTGQRLDQTGLYYYGARYYDVNIGRFISPDSIVPDPYNPQSLNRYSYCLNKPLRFIDPSGHSPTDEIYRRIWEGGGGGGGGEGGDGGGGLIISIEEDGEFSDVLTNIQHIGNKGVLLSDVFGSTDKCISDPFTNTQVRMSNETLDQLLAQGYTVEQIACMVNTEPGSKTRFIGISEINSENMSWISTAGCGSYFVLFTSGFFYIGKGGLERMRASIARIERFNGVKAVYSRWETASSNKQSFVDEYLKMESAGFSRPGVKSYNEIWSPGRSYYYEDMYRRWGW
jgi:RHS repeat-associated protein